MMTMQRQRVSCGRRGAALVMVVVLTVLLAGIGTLFVMVSRLDEMATSSITCDRDLDNAVQSAVDLISLRLTEGVPTPGVLSSFGDYPGRQPGSDRWLAPLVPGLRDNRGTPGDYSDDIIRWEHVSDLTGQITDQANTLPLRALVYTPPTQSDLHLRPADADGDGVTDSYWVRLPFLNTSRGKPVFAAVRIIDNCAMLNLNTASYIPPTVDPAAYIWPDLEGRYLSSIDYGPFLRGDDRFNPHRIQLARQRGLPPIHPPHVYHHEAIMHIEDAVGYSLFDIADELEIRNRFMLSSPFVARFEREDLARFTFAAGGGNYAALSVPRDTSNFAQWIWRTDPSNFDDWSGAFNDGTTERDYRWRYDRRPVCTFYSFDRNLRLGVHPATDVRRSVFPPDPLAVSTAFGVPVWNVAEQDYIYLYNNIETRVQILKLLYALRAYYLARDPDYTLAARSACQFVANMIDYIDDTSPDSEGPFFSAAYGSQRNPDPTFINRSIIRQLIREVSGYLSGAGGIIDIGETYNAGNPYEFGMGRDNINETVYGYERQPFISKIVRYRYERDEDDVVEYYAIELCNPYDREIPLKGWRIKVGDYTYVFRETDAAIVPAVQAEPPRRLGKLVLVDNTAIFDGGGSVPRFFELPATPAGPRITADTIVELQRAGLGTDFITVDRTTAAQAAYVAEPVEAPNRWRISCRDDTKWRFANSNLHDEMTTEYHTDVALGRANGLDLNGDGYQLPVTDNNKPIGTLLDFTRVLLVGNERAANGTMKPITEHVASAAEPSRGEVDLRMDVVPSAGISPLDYMCFIGRPQGSLPGRININTATMEVIRAAIRDHADADTPVDNEELARNIVQSRNTHGPYRRITELLEREIGFTQFVNNDPNVGDPQMAGDFEERNWILSQVANLFTVRSDVFTAYILVALDHDGPQRRMIAIFDRTNVSRDPLTGLPTAKPRIIALHPVPDSR